MVKEKKQILIGSDEDEELGDSAGFGGAKSGLSINKKYAERYDNWRNKEELQKCNLEFFNEILS